MISKKLMIFICAISFHSYVLALQKVSNAVADWDARVTKAAQLATQLKSAQANEAKREDELNDYCNSNFGFHGRMLKEYLTDSQKRQVYSHCGDAMKNKNPKAYEAVQAAGQTKAALTAKYADSGSAKDFASNATALKERMKAQSK